MLTTVHIFDKLTVAAYSRHMVYKKPEDALQLQDCLKCTEDETVLVWVGPIEEKSNTLDKWTPHITIGMQYKRVKHECAREERKRIEIEARKHGYCRVKWLTLEISRACIGNILVKAKEFISGKFRPAHDL